MKKTIFLLILFVFPVVTFSQVSPIGLPNDTFGQINSNTGLPEGVEEQISVTILPSVPKPNEVVTISIETYSFDLNKSEISWYINDVLTESGTGLKSFTLQAPESGERMIVRATINKELGGTISKSFTIAPADVDLVWQADTYSPPFYKGKSLFTRQSTITLNAIPNFVNLNTGQTIPSSSLVYEWKYNGDVLPNSSGQGRDRLEITGDIIARPISITVTVSAIGSDLQARTSLTINTFDPEIVLYENNPIYGVMFEKALSGSFMINRNEMEISAVPYSFSAENRDDDTLTYKWLLNGQTIQTYGNRKDLVFRKTTESTGKANISITTNNEDKFLQTANTSFSVMLEGTTSGNAFSF